MAGNVYAVSLHGQITDGPIPDLAGLLALVRPAHGAELLRLDLSQVPADSLVIATRSHGKWLPVENVGLTTYEQQCLTRMQP